ncbi:MerR family transcriptional regulator [Litoribrevibacter euphylliae]|uniref:MerR family transcriptional regulator n=1 Tax=Litoribrevibacter euphylliae TaxID=1834034 RepID=A0ABV7HHX7_9GAMM
MKIGLVSENTGLGIHTIRYYEKQGLINQPKKDASGHRAYNGKDVDLLNWIACMKNSGMPLSRIKEYSVAFYNDDSTTCLSILEDHLEHLKEQQKNIEHYVDVTANKISRLKGLT